MAEVVCVGDLLFDFVPTVTGTTGWEAVLQRDYPVVMGLVVFTGVLTILGNLLADLAYAAIDPRIKLDS